MRGLGCARLLVWILVLIGLFGLLGCASATAAPPNPVTVAINDPYAAFPDETFLNKTPNPPALDVPEPQGPKTFRTPIANPEPAVIEQLEENFKIYDAKLNLADFETVVEFVNPTSQLESAWDYGILFRIKNLDESYRVYLDSEGEWGFGYGNQPPLAGGTLDRWNSKVGEVNTLRVVALGKYALFFVNDIYVSVLDVSAHDDAGTIIAGTGILPGHMPDEAATRTKDFRVWRIKPEVSIPAGSLTVTNGIQATQVEGFNHPNFIARVTFVNPSGVSKWDYGLTLRMPNEKHYLAVMLSSEGRGFGRFMNAKEGVPLSYALPEYDIDGLNKDAGQENEIVLYAYMDHGFLLVNGHLSRILDFSDWPHAGDVRPLANGITKTNQTYTVTYKDFSVVPIP